MPRSGRAVADAPTLDFTTRVYAPARSTALAFGYAVSP